MGTSSHIPFSGNGGARVGQILRGVNNMHRHEHEKNECLYEKKTIFTNVSGSIPDDMITKINLVPADNNNTKSSPTKPSIEYKSNTYQRPISNKTHRRSGRVEDLDYTQSLADFVSNKKKAYRMNDRRALVAAHYDITQHMVHSIQTHSTEESKKYRVLSKTLQITGKFCKSVN